MTMKFRAHETFFIRKGWLSKGMKSIVNDEKVFINKDVKPTDVLGIGSNMVKSLRYWLQAVGLTSELSKRKGGQQLTEFGKAVFDNDLYLEEIGTLFLLQYMLAKQFEEATAWYYFFNEFSMSEFTREDFVQGLQNYISMQNDGSNAAIRSLNDDFTCIINTYLPRYKSNPGRVSPENNIDCPLGELGLIDYANKKQKTYKKALPSPKTLDSWVILAVIMDNALNRKEIPLSELLNAPCNVGKVFNLDAISLIDVLNEAEKTGIIKIIRTAGLDVIQINGKYSFIDCVHNFYKSVNEKI